MSDSFEAPQGSGLAAQLRTSRREDVGKGPASLMAAIMGISAGNSGGSV